MGMAEDICVRIGRRLRKLRKQQGWTQVQMAEIFGLDRSYLADVEHGKRNVSARNLEIIARGFGLTLSKFFSRI
jgi:transcriptional regulator with XRE-family HTH domain